MSEMNQIDPVQTLLNRVESLEQQNRRMKRTGLGLLGASVCFALMGAATPFLCKTVWAERLVLRNASGQEVMAMDAYTGDTPTITMRDDHGKSLVRLSWEDGVKMDFLDKKGKTETSVNVSAKGETRVTRRNEAGELVSMAD